MCERLAECSPALLRITEVQQEGETTHYATTAEGQALLEGRAQPVGWPKYWLGGCEVSGVPHWLWDSDSRRLVSA